MVAPLAPIGITKAQARAPCADGWWNMTKAMTYAERSEILTINLRRDDVLFIAWRLKESHPHKAEELQEIALKGIGEIK